MQFFKVTSYENTKKVVEDNLKKIISSFYVEVDQSLGKMLSEDIVSSEESPLYNRSTVDGYAVNITDVSASTQSIPSFLNIVGNIKMGEMPTVKINKGECAYVATGALIPEGANAVVMIEHVDVLKDQLAVYNPVANNENIILKGEEIKVVATASN